MEFKIKIDDIVLYLEANADSLDVYEILNIIYPLLRNRKKNSLKVKNKDSEVEFILYCLEHGLCEIVE